MTDSKSVKELFLSLGADLCGVASLDRFKGAPQGYHPSDVMPSCKSVISFGCRFPVGTLRCASHTPYTHVRNTVSPKMDAMALNFCIEMERRGTVCVPVPTNECEWDERTGRWRSIVSQKHAAQAAGLGVIGKHSLIITPELGSMVWLGAVLCEDALEPDALKPSVCADCHICVDVCPVGALSGPEIKQQVCQDHAFGTNPKTQSWQISCHKCRDACPYNLGSRNSLFK